METPPPVPQTRAITGLFRDPRPTEPDIVVPLARPESPFAPWDGESTVLYDTLAQTETNLGPGGAGKFSPNNQWLLWTARVDGHFAEARIAHLVTGEQRSLGEARDAGWFDDSTVVVISGGVNERWFVDIESAVRQPFDPTKPRPRQPSGEQPRFRLDYEQCELQGCVERKHELTDGRGVLPALVFDAYRAVLADDDTLVIATRPDDGSGTVNIFTVDVLTAASSFVATAVPTGSYSALNWPLDANADYIIWSDDHCRPNVTARSRLYDRLSGTIRQFALDGSVRTFFTLDGAIASGPFYVHELIDPDSLEYTVVLPVNAAPVNWSANYRYASVGVGNGHGGLCG